MNISEKLRLYKLKDMELACLLLYIATNNKTFAWSQTIGSQSQSNNKPVLANQWFRNQVAQMYIYDYEKENVTNVTNESDVTDKRTKDSTLKQFNTVNEITSDNIKSLLESEFERTSDPEKRTTLLIKIADFLSLNKTNEEDFATPLIYLPSRCQACVKNV